MRHLTVAFALALFGTSLAHAGIDVRNDGCSLHSDYSLKVEPDRLVFARKAGAPAVVVIADGSLLVDGHAIDVAGADRERLRNIEEGVRAVLPEFKAIAHEAIAIAFEAVAQVSAAFARDGDAARASARRMARTARELNHQIDARDSFSNWSDADIDRLVDSAVGSLVGEITGTIAARAVSVALSGDVRAAADLEARADGIEKNIDRMVAKRSGDLERRAGALCSRVRSLATLESSLDVRLADGRHLELVRIVR